MYFSAVQKYLRGKGYETIVRTKRGFIYDVCLDDWISWNLYAYGDYRIEADVSGYLLASIKPGATFLDIGANIGFYTVPAAAKGAAVHAFEPCSDTADRLERNIQLNSLTGIAVNRLALDEKRGTALLNVGQRSNMGQSSIAVQTGGTSETVSVTTLDDYAENLAAVDIIKIDVEGAEERVLRGAQSTLARFSPRIFMELSTSFYDRHGLSVNGTFEFMSALGYHSYYIEDGCEQFDWKHDLRHAALMMFAKHEPTT